MNKNTCKAHTDEEWLRDGVKRMSRSQDMAVWVFGGQLTNKTVQKGRNAAKTSRSKAISMHKNTRKAHTDEK